MDSPDRNAAASALCELRTLKILLDTPHYITVTMPLPSIRTAIVQPNKKWAANPGPQNLYAHKS